MAAVPSQSSRRPMPARPTARKIRTPASPCPPVGPTAWQQRAPSWRTAHRGTMPGGGRGKNPVRNNTIRASAGHARSHDVRLEADSVGFLQLADISRDRRDISIGDPFEGRHVSEPPMVSPDSVPGCEEKGLVGMVSGIVYVVDERRTVVRSVRLGPMARGAIGFEQDLAGARHRRQACRLDNASTHACAATENVVADKANATDENKYDGNPADRERPLRSLRLTPSSA